MTGGRTAIVGVLVGGAIAAVLVGWYRAGMRAVEREEASFVEAARRDAADRAASHADALAARLEELRVAESARPYLHYQNLFHDPSGASEGLAVVPSPLAAGTVDPLVALNFQIDERGGLTSPSVNDAVPEAVQSRAPDRERGALAALAAARGDVIAAAAGGEVAVEAGPRVAVAERRPARRARPASAPVSDQQAASAAPAVKGDEALAVQTVEVDPDVYQQNANSNAIFLQNRAARQEQQAPQRIEPPAQAPPPSEPQVQAPVQPRMVEPAAQAPPRVEPAPTPPRRAPPRRRAAPAAPPTPPPPVIVTVAPLTWHTLPIAGEPTLVAVRRVVTPDGVRTQGFTVGREQLAAWLAEHDAAGATLGTDPAGAPLGLGGAPWTITVDDRDDIRYAHVTGAILRDSFLVQFVPIAALAILCGALVVLVTARAERLARQRARFAAAAAHELRTPLAGIQLYGDMLGEHLGDPGKHRDYAHRIALEAARLGRVVANVLGVSQLERGGLTVRTETADVVGAVRDAVERAEPGLTRAGATVELVAPAALTARFDRDAVARIVGNLLDNAEKYGRGAADRHITVAIARAGDHVEIAVRDRGPGLPAKLRRGRFEAFRRGAGDDAPPGLGLGLALSQALAHAMDGALAPRAVSPGAELVLRLPAA